MENIMFIADMHCDSLLTVSGERGLLNAYNFSTRYPQLQVMAHFIPNDGRSAEVRRRELIKYLNICLYECERLNLSRIMSGRELFSAVDNELRSVILSVEGGGGLFADSPELVTMKNAGLSVLGLAWDDNELASCAWTKNDMGLTEEGKKLADRCCELGIILDVSHLSDKAFYELYDSSPMPMLATHSNFREVCASPRNLTRDMALKLASRGGVIGLNLLPIFLSDSGKAEREDILRHVDYALSLFGDDRHLGFGFDIDGGEMPSFISTECSVHEQVCELLLSHYSAETVERIAGLNTVEFFEDNLL